MKWLLILVCLPCNELQVQHVAETRDECVAYGKAVYADTKTAYMCASLKTDLVLDLVQKSLDKPGLSSDYVKAARSRARSHSN